MKPQLLKSAITVFLFWFIATALYWSFCDVTVSYNTLKRLHSFLSWIPFLHLNPLPTSPNWLNVLSYQYKVIYLWTIPVVILSTISFFIGFGFTGLKNYKFHVSRLAGVEGSGKFRGVTVSKGVLPVPKKFDMDELDLEGSPLLKKLDPTELTLIADILGIISAANPPYKGEGVSIPLIDHCVNLLQEAIKHPSNPGLCAVVACAHELGKITAYKQDQDGHWFAFKNHDREAGRILSTLESWYNLPLKNKMAVLMAVKYKSNPKAIPSLSSDPNVYNLARELYLSAGESRHVVEVEEKQKTLEKTEVSEVLFEAFLKAMPSLSFQNRGLPKGVAAVAWKFGNRVYMIEIKLRETVSLKLPDVVKGALTSNAKDKQKVQPFTVELLKALQSKGWLVTEIDNVKLDPKEALWNVKAGKLEFKGVIVIDVPDEYLTQLPGSDSMYEILVTGPLFTSSVLNTKPHKKETTANPSFSKADLGDVLKPTKNS